MVNTDGMASAKIVERYGRCMAWSREFPSMSAGLGLLGNAKARSEEAGFRPRCGDEGGVLEH